MGLPKRNVVLSLKELVAMLPNLSLNFIPLRSVLITQGGLYQIKNQPQKGKEACSQEMVLCTNRRVWTCLRRMDLNFLILYMTVSHNIFPIMKYSCVYLIGQYFFFSLPNYLKV